MNPTDPTTEEPARGRPQRREADPIAPAWLAELNERQREAVVHEGGPLLVLAGAGSGKTRVITRRIAHLILDRGVDPAMIFAVTFTNKAAAEMRERVRGLLGGRELGSWIGTFHALCLRILRADGARIGLESGFNVYDSDDQLALIKRLIKDDPDAADVAPPPRTVRSRISRAKNAMETADELERRAFTPERQLVVRVWREYDTALRRANAADFDDLLLRTLELFGEHPDVAERYASRCRHLLVDEYQDTNRPQYLLVRALSAHQGNVCVVGDEDQCIYRFRGAELRNILEFEGDHEGARIVRLEQNYRSTGTILDAAGAVVANNRLRRGKVLWTENPGGEKIELMRAPDDRSEAAWVARRTRELAESHPFGDVAVLYRTNAQSRQLEEAFRQAGLPYQVVGAVQFYARKEVKDILAYLRLLANPADDVSFRRAVNTPPRGIGDGTLAVVERVARTHRVPLLQAARHAVRDDLLATRAQRCLSGFLDLLDGLAERLDDLPVPALVERVVRATDYEEHLERVYSGLASERIENVRALVSAAVEHAEENERATLEEFLDRSALTTDVDRMDDAEPGITLMTVHCAKGLEFPVVFLIGLEENLFPHAMSVASEEDVEEERRLCYVAMTRARERLLLAHARFRRLQGTLLPNPASRFLEEIPANILDELAPPAVDLLGEAASHRGGWSAGGSGSSAARAAARRGAAPRRTGVVPGPPSDDGFDVGATVEHPLFGSGTIVDREGSGRSVKLTIEFGRHGVKKILPTYTDLRVRTA